MKKEILELTNTHNSLVSDKYVVDDVTPWILTEQTLNEGYIEIPSNQTKSGHAEILEFDVEIFQ